MPTYEYRCPKGHEFEKFQRMSEPPAAQCPACGQEATRLLSGGAGLLFKGEGFYITDYRSDSYKKAAESDRSAGTAAGEPKGASEAGGPKGGAGKGSETKGAEPKGGAAGKGGGEGSGVGKPGTGSSGSAGSGPSQESG
jgi:putative FmdB family regulatory protein